VEPAHEPPFVRWQMSSRPEAARLAGELDAPVVFVYVPRGPATFFGAPVYQRRLSREMTRARRVLDRALTIAEDGALRPRA
jgi:hypothetical protein